MYCKEVSVLLLCCAFSFVLAETGAYSLKDILRRLSSVEANVAELRKLHVARAKRYVNPSVVAFAATLSSSVTIQPHKVLVYDRVITNIQSAYDSSSGVFTAPTSGVYQFTATVANKKADTHNTFELAKNGFQLCVMHSHADYMDTGTCSSVVHLLTGDRVFVRHLSDMTFVVGTLPNFSGHLIATDLQS